MIHNPQPAALRPGRWRRIAAAVTVPVRAIRDSSPRTRITVAAGVLVLGLGWMLGPGAGWVLRHVDGVHGLTGKDLAAALDAVRGRALAIATGLLALTAVYYTARNADTARRTFQLGEQGQVTERYTKSIEQLGSETRDIRLGGIYGLERIAADSARDHPTVMEVLTAFVREHAPVTTTVSTTTGEASPPPAPAVSVPTADIQAALTVIGRRTAGHDTRPLDLFDIDVAGANLAGANLSGANLHDAHMIGANLSGANLHDAHMIGAHLIGAHMIGANLIGAHMIGANLHDANLADAYLFDANLIGAKLHGAHLDGAHLSGAHLSGASLRDANLHGAHLDRAHLADANLSGANLHDANLADANLHDANLDSTNLHDANLADANLVDANLIGANLIGAKLHGTHLDGAHLSGANLHGAHLDRANLDGVIWTELTVWPGDADIERIRMASQEITPGVFRIGEDGLDGPTP
ncbi:MAG: Pentapeptide repeat family protein [Actinoallomurus sp.]|nr:Pentapeptide repeat family protein [Actinoallomurus sp.]